MTEQEILQKLREIEERHRLRRLRTVWLGDRLRAYLGLRLEGESVTQEA